MTNLTYTSAASLEALKGTSHRADTDKIEAPYEVAGEAIIYDSSAVSQASVRRATRFARRRRATFLPFLVTAAIFTPHGQLVSEAPAMPPVVGVRLRGEDWDDEWDEDDFWSYAPDFVTTAQVRELDELMALPVPPELSIHFDDDLA